MRFIRGILITLLLSATAYGHPPAQTEDSRTKLLGNWAGESICARNRPACHDEKVVYRITLTLNQPSSVTIQMDKIIDGKADTMATLDFVYDPKKNSLTSEFTRGRTHGIWQFTVQQQEIKGVLLVLPEKEVARNVSVKKGN